MLCDKYYFNNSLHQPIIDYIEAEKKTNQLKEIQFGHSFQAMKEKNN